MPDHSSQVVRFLTEVWNHGNLDVVDELVTPESILNDGASITKGPQAFREYYSHMQQTFSDLRMTTHEAISSGDYGCVRWSATMRHTGDGLGMPATGRTLTTTGITMCRFDDVGRMIEGWQNWDMLGLLEQIRQAPSPRLYVTA